MEGDWRDEFALVYEAAASRGIGYEACDRAEIWVLASQLGANRPDESDPLMDDDGYTWGQRRAIALARGEPEPQWDDVPMSPREQADLERLASGAQVMMPPENVAPS